jgi:predicted N-acetyltransferase YhbS
MVRQATPSDNEQLLRLTSQSAMEGKISLRIDRGPDFFALLEKRGESTTFVIEQNHKIVGSISLSKGQAYIDQQLTTLHYISDLKIDQMSQGRQVAYRLMKTLNDFIQGQEADLVLGIVADGNFKMDAILAGRLGLPKFESIGTFKVFQFLPARTSPHFSSCEVYEAPASPHLVQLVNAFSQKYQLGKFLPRDCQKKFLIAVKQGAIVAALSMLDTSSLKQNVVIKVGPLLHSLLLSSQFLPLPLPRLPALGEPIRMLYVDNFFYAAGHEEAFLFLMQKARHLAYQQQFHFLSLGLHTKDPLIHFFKSWFKFTFLSNGFITSAQGNKDLLRNISRGLPYNDFSLV